MEKFNKILLLLIIILIVFSVGYSIGYRKAKSNINDNIVIQDTTYNPITLDSIKYRLIEKDSIIYNIKEDLKYDIQEAINANDSNVVKQFYELVSE